MGKINTKVYGKTKDITDCIGCYIYIDSDNLFHTPDMATLLIEDEGFYTVTITS